MTVTTFIFLQSVNKAAPSTRTGGAIFDDVFAFRRGHVEYESGIGKKGWGRVDNVSRQDVGAKSNRRKVNITGVVPVRVEQAMNF